MVSFVLVLVHYCSAQYTIVKNDTIKDGQLTLSYWHPETAINAWKKIHLTLYESIFQPLDNKQIKYGNGSTTLQDWSHLGFENVWSQNPMILIPNVSDYEAIPYTEPDNNKWAPCWDERFPGVFLKFSKFKFYFQLANVPSVYNEQDKEHPYPIFQQLKEARLDSLSKVDKTGKYDKDKYTSQLDIKKQTRFYLCYTEMDYYYRQTIFSLQIDFNRFVAAGYCTYNDNFEFYKSAPFSLHPKHKIAYEAGDKFYDYSEFRRYKAGTNFEVDLSMETEASKLWTRRETSFIVIGQSLTRAQEERMRKNHDYSVYNIIIKVEGPNIEKNHEILNTFDWNKLYSIINTQKMQP